MKIENIIKNALVERRLISEDEVGQQPSGQSTRSFDLNNPEDVLNAAQKYDCWKQWKLDKKPIDITTKKEFKISYRNQEKSIPAGTRFLYSAPLLFFGEKIQGESDKDNTYFYGFDSQNLSNNLFKGFRWTCSSLRSVDQSGTRNVTPSQQKLLDDFLATYGSVYTKVGGQGKVAKDITDLKYKDGRTVWNDDVGIPPKGNFVYVQETLYNVEGNQLIEVAEWLKNNGYTLNVPPITDPAFNQGQSLITMLPALKKYNLPADVKAYPIDATFVKTKTGFTGNEIIGKTDKNSCTAAIKYLTACLKNSGQSEPCQDVKQRAFNVDYAAKCYLNFNKEKAKNPTKLLGGIFGPEDELMRLVNVSNNVYGIGTRVRELKSTSSMNESKRIDYTIKNHLLENIRNKNSQL